MNSFVYAKHSPVPASHKWAFAAFLCRVVKIFFLFLDGWSAKTSTRERTLLSSTFRLYGSLPQWNRDFLNLSMSRRLMLWCGAGGSWRWNKDKANINIFIFTLKCNHCCPSETLFTYDFTCDPIKIQFYKTRITGFCSVKLNSDKKSNRNCCVTVLEWCKKFCAAARGASEWDRRSAEPSSGTHRSLLTLRWRANTDWLRLNKQDRTGCFVCVVYSFSMMRI